MSATEAPAGPDLSALDKDVRLRIEVENAIGGEWLEASRAGPVQWRFFNTAGDVAVRIVDGEGANVIAVNLPDYPGDPAAWGALMERERVGCFPFAGKWRALAARDSGGMRTGLPRESMASTPGRAVALAVLAKHGRDTSRYTEGAAR